MSLINIIVFFLLEIYIYHLKVKLIRFSSIFNYKIRFPHENAILDKSKANLKNK